MSDRIVTSALNPIAKPALEALAVREARCPVCGAVPGKPCVKLSASARSWVVDANGAMGGQWRKHPHPERITGEVDE